MNKNNSYMDLYYAFSTLLRLVTDLQTENNELYHTNVRLDKMLKSIEDTNTNELNKVRVIKKGDEIDYSILDYVFIL